MKASSKLIKKENLIIMNIKDVNKLRKVLKYLIKIAKINKK